MRRDRIAAERTNDAAPLPTNARSTTQINKPAHFPPDAHAVIAKAGKSAMTSGRSGSTIWKLRFERRSPPYIEPLMGWTANDDTLSQVELSFPTAESAIAYARRQGLPYTVVGWTAPCPDLKVVRAARNPGAIGKSGTHPPEWIERTSEADVFRTVDSASIFEHPRAEVDPTTPTAEQNQDMLYRWAYDSYLLQRANPSIGEQSNAMLSEVVEALRSLEKADAGSRNYRQAA